MSKGSKSVIVVTGASRGLGKAVALRYGRAGNAVVVNYREHAAAAEQVVRDIAAAGGQAMACRADIGCRNDADRLVVHTLERWGRIDVLVNNAGSSRDKLLLRMSEEDWDSVLSTNLAGPFYAIRAAAKTMMKQRSGHIVSISSITGVQGREGQANYAASKAGLIGLTKAAALEMGRFNIKVNAVLPGYLPTDMGDSVSETFSDRIRSRNALGRANDPNEVAEFIYRLSLMKNVSGQVFNLDSRIF